MKKIIFLLLITLCVLTIVIGLFSKIEHDYDTVMYDKTNNEFPLIQLGIFTGLYY